MVFSADVRDRAEPISPRGWLLGVSNARADTPAAQATQSSTSLLEPAREDERNSTDARAPAAIRMSAVVTFAPEQIPTESHSTSVTLFQNNGAPVGFGMMLNHQEIQAPALLAARTSETFARLSTDRKKLESATELASNASAMAASYDPDPMQFFGIRLPVTFDTCEIIEERWANWLRQDPVVAIETQASNLRRLKALYIDCGEMDQFNLLYGTRRFVRRLNELDIAHRYEEFPDNHTGVDYRMDESLPFLAQALSG
jgi:hypothetical protein